MIQSRLSVLMAERGLKISDLYEETGISKTTLMAIAENTGKGVQFETVDKLCNFLGVTPCEFFEYSPYLVDIKEYEEGTNQFKDIEVTINKQNYEKTFYLEYFIFKEGSYDIPVKNEGFKSYIAIDLMDTDHYDRNEFFNFVSDLTVGFKMDLINKILNHYKREVENFVQNEKEIDTIERTKVLLSKNDRILIHLFNDSKIETLKKIKL
ncbi:helix-turn-helix transcriptional regulator [Staphylococcus capitis]|uniref:helix-turn-helix domain-containing protein n=1 Tax=Staphylococcus TaxID=1279 RepID=UPI0005CA2AB0|nr:MULTISPECIES: helix-turn-helix transcriptional regulator [Staphylococcus]MDH9707143.1 helix-turn-helix transcriptional regulator [Staphylococcus epidermidis]MDH9712668.1 helix-turn-helix transcriptional regulator [Staphylococcus epidermidis]MDH9919602.1 helix-turn-helix transcriptional regulator [Staphylococcus epidermidis]MDH9932485.1 helix-turn-helix transcriptional regulator [Staphylococcus epidermidis]MDH9937157.1 helix-turn-helix transcriptional regulator [Staphylococcus epidermidis]